MGLLDSVLSAIDSKKRTLKRGVMDMLDNPGDWSNMTAARMKESLYGSPENWDAMKKYLQQQPYDQKLKDAAQQSMINNAVNESLGAVTAWHGSPHKFDKFDMSKIGTGEGAQAYGHGLYMAELPEVANEYRKKLQSGPLGSNLMKVANESLGLSYHPAINTTEFLDIVGPVAGDGANAISNAIKKAASKLRKSGVEYRARLADDLDKFAVNDKLLEDINSTAVGKLYKIDIPDEAVPSFIDWNKTLDKQSNEIKKILSKNDELQSLISETDGQKYWSGENVYRAFVHSKGSPENASEYLKSLGIPGIRYLDAGSRSAGQGSSNFVLFDDQLPRILERNGEPTGLQPWAKGEWKGLLDYAPTKR